MSAAWITNASTRPGHVINSLTAACDAGFVPDALHLLSNPSVADQVEPIRSRATSVLSAYDTPDPELHVTSLDAETDFEGVATHYREAIEAAHEADREVAIDITPGRKFMSAIAFQAGFRLDVDHVFYLHVKSNRYHGLLYPEIPRPGLELIDFTEALS